MRPGALPFVFPDGRSTADLIERLRQTSWWGQIIGPHGHGKSNLIKHLLPALQAEGRKVRLIELRAGDRRLPIDPSEENPWGEATQIVVDGSEQLNRWARHRLRRRCRRCGAGLLVTAHRSVGLPDLWNVSTSLELAHTLTRRLVDLDDSTSIRPRDVEQAFLESEGDLRETWFRLYDVYESRRHIMSKVIVNTYANLRKYTGGQPAVEVDLADGATIRTVLEHLGIPIDQTRIIFVDSRAAELDHVLRGGQRVDLFSAIGGG